MPLKHHKSGITLYIRLTPNARQTLFSGIIETSDNRKALKISVTAIPENGKANKALIAFLSKSCKIPKTSISIISGDTNRLKTVLIEGVTIEFESKMLSWINPQ